MSAGTSLMIKYGLPGSPTDQEIKKWLELVQANIKTGMTREKAGEEAAKKAFRGYNTHVYASQAETIDALLALLKGK